MQLRLRRSQNIFAALVVVALASCSSDDEPAPSACGNGKLDGSEQCDKTTFKSGENCRSATMGTKTGGTLSCTAKCTVDSTKCTGSAGTSGTSGAGGMGVGGAAGMGGGGGAAGSDAGKGDATSDVSTDGTTSDVSSEGSAGTAGAATDAGGDGD